VADAAEADVRPSWMEGLRSVLVPPAAGLGWDLSYNRQCEKNAGKRAAFLGHLRYNPGGHSG
jgi:hypothetical protein